MSLDIVNINISGKLYNTLLNVLEVRVSTIERHLEAAKRAGTDKKLIKHLTKLLDEAKDSQLEFEFGICMVNEAAIDDIKPIKYN